MYKAKSNTKMIFKLKLQIMHRVCKVKCTIVAIYIKQASAFFASAIAYAACHAGLP